LHALGCMISGWRNVDMYYGKMPLNLVS
jgi:hypothetical protein